MSRDRQSAPLRAVIFLVDRRLPADAQEKVLERVRRLRSESQVVVKCYPNGTEASDDVASSRSAWKDFDAISSLLSDLRARGETDDAERLDRAPTTSTEVVDYCDVVWFAHRVSNKAPIPVEELHAYSLLKETRNRFPNSVRCVVTLQGSEIVAGLAHWEEILGLSQSAVDVDSEAAMDEVFSQLSSEILWRGSLAFSSGLDPLAVHGTESRERKIDFVRTGRKGESTPGEAVADQSLPPCFDFDLKGSILVSQVLPLACLPLHRLRSHLGLVKVLARDDSVQEWFEKIGLREGELPSLGDGAAETPRPLMCLVVRSGGGAALAMVPSRGEEGEGAAFSVLELASARDDALLSHFGHHSQPQRQEEAGAGPPSGAGAIDGTSGARDPHGRARRAILEHLMDDRELPEMDQTASGGSEMDFAQMWPEVACLARENAREEAVSKLSKGRRGDHGAKPRKKEKSPAERALQLYKEKVSCIDDIFNPNGTLKDANATALVPSTGAANAASSFDLTSKVAQGLSPRSKLGLGWVHERRRQLHLTQNGRQRSRGGHGVDYYRESEQPRGGSKTERGRERRSSGHAAGANTSRAAPLPSKKKKASTGQASKRKQREPGAKTAKLLPRKTKPLKKVKVRRTLDYAGAL